MLFTAPMPTTLTVALKEWAIAVDALTHGKTIVLLRKGGIREQGGQFAVEHPRAWLYPTYEHQKAHLLKPEYAAQVTPVGSGWHPEQVLLQSWATLTHAFQVSDPAAIESLLPLHIWNMQFVTERLKWKPKSPLSVLLLRVYRLPQVHPIPYCASYGGCKSWIELETSLSAIEASPVLSSEEFANQVGWVQTALGIAE